MIHPWQERQWLQIQSAIDAGRLPHAVLLSGAEGMGADTFTRRLLEYLLCDNDKPQQAEAARRLLDAGTHPDVLRVLPEEEGKAIKVGPIRNLIGFIHLSSQSGRCKIAIISPAEAMNRSAANALLKTLEEPPPGALLLLLSHYPAALPATIRSRCQRLHFHPVAAATALDWFAEQKQELDDAEALLALARGAPLKALQLHEAGVAERFREITADLLALREGRAAPVGVAEKWLQNAPADLLPWLLAMLARMARLKCGGWSTTAADSPLNKALSELAADLDLAAILRCYDRLREHQRAQGVFNLNRQGIVEDFTAYWQLRGRA